jgi:SAM-dependent methyltransferase
MRKDYMPSGADEADETDFVERHWTQIWEREGGPQGAIEEVPGRDEYKVMAPYLAALPKGAEILDGGCGLGDWVLYLSRKGYRTIGLDLSRKTIGQLKARFPEAEFAAGDIRATGFEDDRFDAYFSWGVIEHFEAGPQDSIREAFRILKPGGLLFVSTPLDNFRHALRGSFRRPEAMVAGSRFYQYRFTRAELAHELGRAGFEVIEVQPIHKRSGVMRSLHHELGLPYEWLLTKGIAAAFAPLLPGGLIAHMVLAVARKPAK